MLICADLRGVQKRCGNAGGNFFGVKIVNARTYKRENREWKHLGGTTNSHESTRMGSAFGICGARGWRRIWAELRLGVEGTKQAFA